MRFKQQPNDILKRLGMYEPEDIDLDLIAFDLGAEVKRASLNDCEGNILGTSTKAIITINKISRIERQRFSLGHELGHWVNDRGKNLTYRCTTDDMRQRSMIQEDFRQNKEVRANQFSAELLMPDFIFKRYAENLDIILKTARYLANTFNVSLTSTVIRLVELSERPCMIICWDKMGKRRWFSRNDIIPEKIWPHERIFHPQEVFKLSDGVEVDADKWINLAGSENYTVIESIFSNTYDFLSLIWWKDEEQLAHYL